MRGRELWAPAAALVVACTFVHAQTPESDHDALTRRTNERLRVLHDEADRLAAQERSVLGRLHELELARQIANEERRQAETAVADTAREIAALDTQIGQLEEERTADQPHTEARLVELYKLGPGRYARLMLGASDFHAIGRLSRTVAALADSDDARFRACEKRIADLGTARQALTTRHQMLSARETEAAKAQAAAVRAVAAQSAVVHDIDVRRDLNAQLAGELMAAQQKLEATLKGAAGATPPLGPVQGALPWPVPGAIRRRAEAALASASLRRPSIEIQAAEGTPVQAVHDGVVAFAGSFQGLGNLVIVDHGGQTFTLYGYLLETAVGQGVHVAEGDPLGRVGASPTGVPGLYFELRVAGRSVDPTSWLARPR
jgi:septal ring factor EnvC (AmiA/AmiB activator)